MNSKERETFKIVYPDIQANENSRELFNALSILLLENDTQGTNHCPVICGKKSELKFYSELMHRGLECIEVPEGEDNLVYAAKELKKGNIHAILAGNISETGHVITVGVKEIGMQEGIKRASSYFLMNHPEYGPYIFADSGCQPDPKPEQLIEIVKLTCENAKIHGVDTKVALLDGGVSSEKIKEVSQYFEENPIAGVEILGNISFQNAKKEDCKVFIFPDLNAGNIAYKVAERMDNYVSSEIYINETKNMGYQELTGVDNQKHIFSHHAISKYPSVDELVDVALESIKIAREKGLPLQVAFLCFSTAGSGKDFRTIINSREAAKKLIQILEEKQIGGVVVLDKEVQFDTAFLPEKAKKKGMNVSSPSTIFIMPDIHTGRMMGDIAQELGGSSANGPRLQGFDQIINDFSRGVGSEGIVAGHKTTEFELSH